MAKIQRLCISTEYDYGSIELKSGANEIKIKLSAEVRLKILELVVKHCRDDIIKNFTENGKGEGIENISI